MTAEPNDPIDVAVGARIRLIRLLRNQSQQALAAAIGVTFQQVQKYEGGRNRVSASTLSRIATHLGVSISDLMGESAAHPAIVDEAADLLGQTGALELLHAYRALPTHIDRLALVTFVTSAAEDSCAS